MCKFLPGRGPRGARWRLDLGVECVHYCLKRHPKWCCWSFYCTGTSTTTNQKETCILLQWKRSDCQLRDLPPQGSINLYPYHPWKDSTYFAVLALRYKLPMLWARINGKYIKPGLYVLTSSFNHRSCRSSWRSEISQPARKFHHHEVYDWLCPSGLGTSCCSCHCCSQLDHQ